jgi:hypothetical protein
MNISGNGDNRPACPETCERQPPIAPTALPADLSQAQPSSKKQRFRKLQSGECNMLKMFYYLQRKLKIGLLKLIYKAQKTLYTKCAHTSFAFPTVHTHKKYPPHNPVCLQ